MPDAAPRIDERLVAALVRLDRPERPIAETHRRVGAIAEALGLSRPSYEQTRVIVHTLRSQARHSEVGATLLEVMLRTRPPEALLEALAP
jgi:AraC-like DNA-binding protein